MPNAFKVEARVSSFELPAQTKEQIKALMWDLDTDARSIVVLAIAQLWQREIGEPDRDVLGELDDIRARLDKAGL